MSMDQQCTQELWTVVREQQRQIEELKAARRRRFSVRIPGRFALIGLTVIAALSLTGGAFASIPSATGVISGCYLPASGLVRVIDPATQNCRVSEHAISWYATGAPIGAGTITGVLTIDHGGTGSATKNFVDLSTAQTVAGAKTFTNTITGNLAGNVTGNLTGNVTGNVTGNAGTVTNGVYTTGDQVINGRKDFTTPILGALHGPVVGDVTGNVSGNAGTVTNGVYTTGGQTIGGNETFSGNVSVDQQLGAGSVVADGIIQSYQGGFAFPNGRVETTAAKSFSPVTTVVTTDTSAGPAANGYGTATCPSGTVLTGGGVRTDGDAVDVTITQPDSAGTGWFGEAHSNYPFGSTGVHIYAICMNK